MVGITEQTTAPQAVACRRESIVGEIDSHGALLVVREKSCRVAPQRNRGALGAGTRRMRAFISGPFEQRERMRPELNSAARVARIQSITFAVSAVRPCIES